MLLSCVGRIANNNAVAVKYGSSMVDGQGEYRIYQNFWYVQHLSCYLDMLSLQRETHLWY